MKSTNNEINRTCRSSNVPIVFIHGQPGTMQDFTSITSRLPEGYEVFTYDRPGWGQSSIDPCNIEGNATYLMHSLFEHNLCNPILVGYSYGSAIAIRAAIDFPAQVKGLVLISPVGSTGSLSLMDSLLSRLAKYVRRLLIFTRERTARHEGKLRMLLSFQFEQQSLWHDLMKLDKVTKKIMIPTKLIVGSGDWFNPIAGSIALYDEIGPAELLIVRGAGHLLPSQAPDRIVAEILDMRRSLVDHFE